MKIAFYWLCVKQHRKIIDKKSKFDSPEWFLARASRESALRINQYNTFDKASFKKKTFLKE